MVKNDADRKVVEGFENDIKTLARTTEFIVKNNIMTRKEAFEFLNKKGEEYSKKYGRMSAIELMLDLLGDALKSIKEVNDVQD